MRPPLLELQENEKEAQGESVEACDPYKHSPDFKERVSLDDRLAHSYATDVGVKPDDNEQNARNGDRVHLCCSFNASCTAISV